MICAIMQPYFFPYIGYWQLISAVDTFIVYDNIKYTKKGWINRNRILCNGEARMITLPLKDDADHLDIADREISAGFDKDTLLNKIKGAYQKAPYFKETFPLVERVIRYDETDLFSYLYRSILLLRDHLGIDTEIRISSDIPCDRTLKNTERVLAVCEAVGADGYVNAPGGVMLYSKSTFQNRGVSLEFVRPLPFEYPQFGGEFVPWLSIIDVMMFNPIERVREQIESGYGLI